ncbi:MAG TPA: EAL domain-containing protein, partial [Kineosporiaceae bacterium]|nr:EAL domain-containing protein [Kineosporiaceae bacterium]
EPALAPAPALAPDPAPVSPDQTTAPDQAAPPEQVTAPDPAPEQAPPPGQATAPDQAPPRSAPPATEFPADPSTGTSPAAPVRARSRTHALPQPELAAEQPPAEPVPPEHASPAPGPPAPVTPGLSAPMTPGLSPDTLLAVLEAVGVGVVLSDPSGGTIAQNTAARQLLAAGEDTVTITHTAVAGPDGHPDLLVATVLARSEPPAAPEPAVAETFAASPLPDPLTDPDYRSADRERALALAEKRFSATLDHSPTGFAVLTPGGRIVRVNPALTRMLGRSAADLEGLSLADVSHPGDPDADLELMSGIVGGTRDSYTVERRYLRSNGDSLWARTTATAVRDPRGLLDHLVVQFHDLTEVRTAEEALSHQALHDPLTGLPNRTLMLDRVQQALDRTRRSRRRVAVLSCSLDRFKVVNDGVGHQHGDAVLVEVARRMERVLRSSDTAARLGSDEFGVVCEDVADEREAVLVADRIRAAVREPIVVGDLRIVQTVSIGIAVSSARSTDAVSLLRDAGTALHRAEETGQDSWDVVDDELRRRAADRLDIEHALRAAIAQQDLRVYFQPIVDLTTRRPVGHEALVRWQHPTRGLLAPGWFLPVAEETGLIEDIGRWVLLEAARSAARSPSTGYVAVNVSASQVMRAGLVADVEAVLEETGLPTSRLVVELTESVMLGAAPAGRKELHKLDDLGVRIVVDDFGTGFSALSYLRDLPISGIKVDRSFTAGLGEDAQCERIVEALTGLAGGLGVDLVAEGVETERQLALLTRFGCLHAQGYLFGRPAPHEIVLQQAEEYWTPPASTSAG